MKRPIELEDMDGEPVFVSPAWVGGVWKCHSHPKEESVLVQVGGTCVVVKGSQRDVAEKIFGKE